MLKGAARKQRRMTIVFAGVFMLGIAVGLSLWALGEGIDHFYGPTEVVENAVEPGDRFRLGGMVEEGSRRQDGATVQFRVTDMNESVEVVYTGILPSLFREGQGVVTNGVLDENGVFQAAEVLAKHDENYMPAEAVEAMKRAGTWKESSSDAGATQ